MFASTAARRKPKKLRLVSRDALWYNARHESHRPPRPPPRRRASRRLRHPPERRRHPPHGPPAGSDARRARAHRRAAARLEPGIRARVALLRPHGPAARHARPRLGDRHAGSRGRGRALLRERRGAPSRRPPGRHRRRERPLGRSPSFAFRTPSSAHLPARARPRRTAPASPSRTSSWATCGSAEASRTWR